MKKLLFALILSCSIVSKSNADHIKDLLQWNEKYYKCLLCDEKDILKEYITLQRSLSKTLFTSAELVLNTPDKTNSNDDINSAKKSAINAIESSLLAEKINDEVAKLSSQIKSLKNNKKFIAVFNAFQAIETKYDINGTVGNFELWNNSSSTLKAIGRIISSSNKKRIALLLVKKHNSFLFYSDAFKIINEQFTSKL